MSHLLQCRKGRPYPLKAFWVCLIFLFLSFPARADAPPSVSGFEPDPLLLEQPAALLGTGFVLDATSISISGVPQPIIHVDHEKVDFQVSPVTPLGTQTLLVATPYGNADVEVLIALPPPMILSIEPGTIVLGEMVSILGKYFGDLIRVMIGDMEQEVTSATDTQIVLVVGPETPLGGQILSVETPAGTGSLNVSIGQPQPLVKKVSPNPVQRGGLLEIKGSYLQDLVLVTLAGVSQKIIESGPSSAVVHVSLDSPLGPQNLIASNPGGASIPAGPLFVEEENPDVPVVAAVYPPSECPAGARIVVVGHLPPDAQLQIGTSATATLEEDQLHYSTYWLPLEADPAETFFLLGTPVSGYAVWDYEITSPVEQHPRIDEILPDPLFQGASFTILGEYLDNTKQVVLGDLLPEIIQQAAHSIQAALPSDAKPQKAWLLTHSARGASNVLDAVITQEYVPPVPDTGIEDDVSALSDDVAETSEVLDGSSADTSSDADLPCQSCPPCDKGCQGMPAGSSGQWPILLFLSIALWAVRILRRSGRNGDHRSAPVFD